MRFAFVSRVLFMSALVLGASFSAGAFSAEAQQRRVASLPAGGATTPPIGWVQFCQDNPRDCAFRSDQAREVSLTPQAFAELVRLNIRVNREIEQVTDLEHFGVEEYWTYPVNGKGDCEDIVMEKKRRLVALGWPREALLITVVREANGNGHAVLTVRTDRGDYILDNQVDEVKLWTETGYRFIKRQSQVAANAWVSLNGGSAGPSLVAAPARR